MTIKSMMTEVRKLSLGEKAWLAREILKSVEKERSRCGDVIDEETKKELALRWKEYLSSPQKGLTRKEVWKKLHQTKKKKRA